MRVYLDNCVYNRPFDDQSNEKVKIESEAIAKILEEVTNQSIELIWSSVIDYENENSPFTERREFVAQWKSYAIVDILATEKVRELSADLLKSGLRTTDALHIAAAMAGSADCFVTTDDGIIKRASRITDVKILNPFDLLKIIKDKDGY